MTIVVTGGAGFIGANFVRRRLTADPQARVVVIDALTYAGNLANLADVKDAPGFAFAKADICDVDAMKAIFDKESPQAVLHFAAESHVDKSILGSRAFVQTNVVGTQTLLDVARAAETPRFLMVSTDEVYGALGPTGRFTESTPLAPNNPYSASKAGADLMCLSYHRTFGMDVVITRCSNNYGPYQFPEKLIPLMIINALEDKPLPVYGDGMQVRDWVHVEDHCAAIDAVLAGGRAGEVYNIGADNERANIDVVTGILDILDKPRSLIRHVTDRLGHDRRYAIDSTKIETELGFEAKATAERGLEDTVRWYLDHRDWWEAVRTGEYRDYYARQYGERLEGV